MGQTVKLRRSAISGKIPNNSQLELGELSMNTTDGKIFLSKSGSQGPSVEEVIITNTQNTGNLDIVGSISGSLFTGSYIGDGSGLYNIPASGVTGLSLDQISNGASTASIDADGLQINVDTSVTGSLTATEFTGSGLGLTNVPLALSGSDAADTSIDGTFTRIKFDESTGIKISGTTGGDATVFLSGVAAESESSEGRTAKLTVTGATSTWTLTHNLNERHPSVEVFDSNDEVIIPQKIEATSNNQIVVTFATPQTGTVTATVGGGLPSIESGYVGRVLSVDSSGVATWKDTILSGSIDFSTLTDTGSFNTYTSSANGRLDSLETESGSIRSDFNTYTSSNDTTNTTQNSRLTSLETKTGSLDSDISTLDGRVDSLETESGSIRSDFNTYTSSNNTTNSTQDGRLSSLETFTGSIDNTYATDTDVTNLRGDFNTYTSSNDSTNSSQNGRISSLETTSGSHGGRLDSLEEFTASIDDTYATDTDVTNLRNTLNSYTSSNNTTNTTQNSRLSSLETKTGSLDSDISTLDGRIDSLETESGSIRIDFNSHTSSINGRVDSVENEIDTLQTESGSIRTDFNSYTSSNDTTNTTQNNRLTSLETTSGSHNTRLTNLETFETKVDNGLEFTGSNVTIKGNLLVKGTETRVNSTTVDIDDNIISLNGSGAANAGIEVRDTTSPGVLSGSLVWDGSNNYWKAGQKGSEERILLNTDLTTLDGRLDSLETESGSIRSTLNTYTSSNDTLNTTQNSRLSSLETKTGSLDGDISTLDGRVDSLEIKTGSLDGDISTLDGRVDSLETESGSIRTDFNTYTSSNNTTNSTQDGRLSSLETFTGSIDNTYATDQDVTNLRGDFNTYTSSNDNTNSTQNNRLNSLETTSGSHGGRIDSLEEFTASIDDTYATDQDVTDLRSDLNSYTSSNNTTNTTQNNRLSSLETFTGSIDNTYATDQDVTDLRNDLNTYTSSNDSTNTTQNSRLSSIESVTGSFITGYTETQNLDDVTTLGSSTTNSIGVGGLDSTGAISISSTNVIDTNRRIYGSGTSSNTTPAFTFAGDTNTGLSRIGTDAVGLVAAGSRKFYVSNTHAYFQNLPSGVTINGAGLTVEGDTTITGSTTAGSFVKSGGTSSQFLKADGSVDTNTYLTQHPTISASSSSNNSGRTYIQDILLDGNGHVTGITTADETVVNINYYVDGLEFDTGTGVLTASVNGTTNQTVDLDGRYSLTSHNHNIWDLPFTRSSINIDTVGSNNIWDYIHSTSTTDGTYPTSYMHIVSFGDRSHGLQFGSPYSSNTNLYYRQGTDNGASENGANTYRDWKKIWSERDFTSTQVSNWDTAYGWGDHGSVGYITGYTETDTLDDVTSRGATANTAITIEHNGVGLTIQNSASSGSDTGLRIRGARNGQTYSNDNLTSYMLFSNYDDNTTPNNYDLAKIGAGMYDAADDTGYFQILTNNGTSLTKALDIDKDQHAKFYGNLNINSGELQIGGVRKDQNWDTAYGWGDHSTVGYLTGYTDTYLTGATFSANTLTLTKNDGNDVTVSLNALVDVTVTGGSYNDSTQTLTLNKSDSNSIDITGFTIDTNTLLTGATFDDSNGIITLTKNNGDTVTVDIDGRFLQLGGGTMSGDLNMGTNDIFSVRSIQLSNQEASSLTVAYQIMADANDSGAPASLGTYTSTNPEGLYFRDNSNTHTYTIYHTGHFSGTHISNWQTAYGWGDHGTVGYITGYTETDTLATVTARGASTSTAVEFTGGLTTYHTNLNFGVMSGYQQEGTIKITRTDGTDRSHLMKFYNDGTAGNNYIKFAIHNGTVSSTTDVLSLYGNGNLNINSGELQIGGVRKDGNWDTAYGWGDHGTVGYITGYTETDTLATVTSRGATTTSDITTGNITTTKENAAPTVTFHNGGNDMGTNADIAQLNFTADYQGSSIPYGSIEVKTNASSVRTDIDFIVKSTSGNQETALKLQGGSGKPKSFFYNDMDVTGTITATGGNSSNWNTAYGWGDHGTVGYITGYTETDTLDSVVGRGSSTTSDITTGNLTISHTGPTLILDDNNNAGGGGAAGKIIFKNTAGNAIGIGYTADDTASSDLIISTNAGSTYGGYLGLDAGGISDTQADIILDPKTKVQVKGDIDMGTNDITDTKVGQWDTAYGWGDHSTAGYITSQATDFVSKSSGGQFDGLITIKEDTNTSTTDGKSLLTLHNENSDISQQQSFIDFKFTDTNANYTPQVRIGAQVGPDADANAISKEGAGSFVVYTAPVGSDESGNSSGLAEQFRVSYNGTVTAQGQIVATGGNSSQWNTAYGWGDHSQEGYLTSETYTAHEDTSTLNGNYGGNNNGVVVEDITVDSNGHVTAVGTRDLDGRFMTQGQTLTDPDIIENGGNRYDPSTNSPTNEHYAILTYGNGGNVTGQLATHFQTGKLYSRGHNNSWSGWRAYWSDSDFTSTQVSNWDTAYGWGDHAGGGYLTSSSTLNASNMTTGTLPDVMSNSTRYNIGFIDGSSSQNRDKIRVWNSSAYTIGMKNGYDFGHIGSGEYAMSFQMDTTTNRGWWWGTNAQTDDQGVMALTNQGRLNVATSISIGEGMSTTSPSTTPLYVEGTVSGSTVFEVQGTQGQLFSISDSLVGDIFEVSDISGIPILSVNSNGTVTIDDTLQVTGEVFAYYSSDERLKDNIKPIENAIDKIKMIGGYEFDWNSLSRTNSGHDVGVIAQEIEKVLPEVVTTKNDGFKGVRYEKLTSLLIQVNKELIQRVEELEEKLNKSE